MNLFNRCVLPFTLAAVGFLTVSIIAPAQVTTGQSNSPVTDRPSRDDAAALQKKATEAQVRLRGNQDDRDQLKRAVKLNEVSSAKEVLLRNGFTAEDLENAKIILQTGGGKGGGDEVEISATCCDPKVITIQRSLEYFTK